MRKLMLMLSAILLAGPALAQTVTVAVVSQTNTFTAPVTFSDTLTATVGGSVSNSANLGGVAAASWAKLTAGAQTFAGGSTQAMDQASLTNLLIYDTLVMSNKTACPATPATGSTLWSSNGVLWELGSDGVTVPVDAGRIVAPMYMAGTAGYVIYQWYGLCWQVAYSDANAVIGANFIVPHSGNYKLVLVWQTQQANTGKTMGGTIYFSYGANGEAAGFPLIANWNLAIPNADTTVSVSTFGTAVTLAQDNSWVLVQYTKTDTAGGASGYILALGMYLVKQ